MASPFESYQEFYEAEGAIYTFADRPAILILLLIASALIFLYFMYASFTIRKGESSAKNPIVLSILLAATAFSAAEAVYQNLSGKVERTQAQVSEPAPGRKAAPFALLGMMGLGAGAQRSGRRRRLSRRDWR